MKNLAIAIAVIGLGITGYYGFKHFKKTSTPTTAELDRPTYTGIHVPRLVQRPMAEGQGPSATTNSTVVIKHQTWIYDTKKPSNRGNMIEDTTSTTKEVRLGSGNIIRGLNDGLVGMKVGEKKQLIIPANLAYGDQTIDPHIFPGAIILAEVELVEIKQ